MIRLVLSNILRFVSLLLVQVTILNNIGLHNFINPYLYVLFILLLPLDTPKWMLLFLGFLIGMAVDLFSNTAGMHTAASTFMAFCRPLTLNFVTPRGGYEHEQIPGLKTMGARWFITYASILVVLHHLLLFNIEIFRFSEFFVTLVRVILSSAFTILLIILSQYLFSKGKER